MKQSRHCLSRRLVCLAVFASLLTHGSSIAKTADQRDARMVWRREAKFGMFICWGLYAVPAGEWKGRAVDGIGDWIMNKARILEAENAGLAK